MSVAERTALYEERTGSVTAQNQIDQAIAQLADAKGKVRRLPITERARLAEDCLAGMLRHRREWVEAACRAKGIAPNTPSVAEESGAGPMATARYLRLIRQSLLDISTHGVPRLPGSVVQDDFGRVRAQVVPAKGLFDSLAFAGFRADVVMQDGVTLDNLSETMAGYFQNGQKDEGVACVLGAGNVSSIAPTDAFSKIFQEGKVVLLKMNPVNEYLGPIFEKSFAPLIDAGFLRIVYGGADVGSHICQHPLVDEVHITGSIYSHETIVWGPPGEERNRRKEQNNPVLKKEITSELGNVTPWIIVPGPYSDKELRFQAENLVASIVNNGSFNCVATKVVVTWKGWKDRQKFLGYVRDILDKVPPRQAYYPGAKDRFRKFAHAEPSSTGAELPWTFIEDVDSKSDGIYFNEESFVCVFAETALDAADERDFLRKATDFANDRLWGTLAATVMIHPKFRKSPENEKLFQRCLLDLRFGAVGVNYWSALAYAMMSPPWGGFPEGSLDDPKSGIGWVHNTYCFDRAEKTILEGPLTLFPKPLWFPTNRGAPAVVEKVIDLYAQPSVFKIPGLLLSALRS